MTIVPRQTDLIDDLINVAQRLGQNERGCTGGPETEDVPPDTDASGDPLPDPDATDAPQLQTITRDIIIAKEGARRSSGQRVFRQGGVWPKLGAAKLVGHGVDPDTYVAQSVEFQGAVRYWLVARAGVPLPNLSSAVGALMFQLPPGWWPPAQIEREVEVSTHPQTIGWSSSFVPKQKATLRINTSGQVIYAAGPTNPTRVELSQFGAFAAGGGACPGFPADDPTGAFDGRQWDICAGGLDGQDDPADPTFDPTAPPPVDGGGGVPAALTWTNLEDAGTGATLSKAQVAVWGDLLFFRGMAFLPVGTGTVFIFAKIPAALWPTITATQYALTPISVWSAAVGHFTDCRAELRTDGYLQVARRTGDLGNAWVYLQGLRLAFPTV